MSRLRRLLQPVNWKYAVGEVSLIVVGVLIALAANAGWEGRQERARERAYLVQLLADTRENERRIEHALREDSAYLAAADRVIGILADSAPLPPNDSLLAWIRSATFLFNPDLVTGTYAALLQTGDIRLLRSDEARLKVIAYVGALERARDGMRHVEEENYHRVFSTWMSRVFSYRRPGPAKEPTDWATRRFAFDFSRVRDDPEMLAIMAGLHALKRNHINTLERLREQTRTLRGQLEAELHLSPDEPLAAR